MLISERLRGNSLISGAGIYLTSSAISAVIPFILLPVLTRFLTPSEYGEIAVFQVWVSLMGALCGLSVHGAAGRKYYDYKNPDKEIGEFVTACLVILFVSSGIMFISVVLLSSWLSESIGLSRRWLAVGVLYALFNFLIQLRLGQWQVRKQAVKFGIFQISQGLLNMLLTLILVVVVLQGVDGRLMASTASVVTFGMLAVVFLHKDGLIKLEWRQDLMKEAAAFGIPLIPHIVGAFLLLTVDRALISAVLGLEQAGYYMVAAQLVMVLSIILDSINKAYAPWLYEVLNRHDEDEKIKVIKLTYAYYVFLILAALSVFLLGKPILIFIAGEEYKPASDIVAWVFLAQVFRGMYLMVTNYIFFAKKTIVISMITLTCGSVNVILMLLMMNSYGLKGAAWAFCISMALQWLVTWFYANRLVSMPWRLIV